MLKILADENIPYAQTAFGTLGRVRLLPGRAITPQDLWDAHVLLVRSVTPVGPDLLAGSHVQFVGSATIGTDHIDRDWLEAQDIAFAHAPGSNADSVVEYVLGALLRQAVAEDVALEEQTVGIVGCGNIGGRLAERLQALGVRVLLNDPPLQAAAEVAGTDHAFVSLAQVLAEADAITVHTPLSRDNAYPTWHLIAAEALSAMRPGAWLVNTARGAVVDNAALHRALHEGRLGAALLDVWENEPTPDPGLMRRTALATPHIAGYSFDGKLAGTAILYDALVRHLGIQPSWDPETALTPSENDHLALVPPDPGLTLTPYLHAVVEQMYAISEDDARLRQTLRLPPEEQGAAFTHLRKTYPRRRAFDRHHLPAAAVPLAYRRAVEDGLRVQLV